MSNTGKHVVIIGAGIAGLSAASYLLRNGYRVTLVEQHTQPGGLCTSWKRAGYTIDYCVHWLIGTREDSRLRHLWEELGAFTNKDGSLVPVVNFSDFATIGLSSGETIRLYSDLDALQKELIRIAREDERMIRRFCRSLGRLSKLDNPRTAPRHSLGSLFSDLRDRVGVFITIMQHLEPMGTYARRFKSPVLREMLLSDIPEDWSLLSLTMGLSQQLTKSAGYTVGGSLNLARNIERGIHAMGGTLRYGTRVEEVIVGDNIATGIRLSDGSVIEADHVVSAADGYQTLFGMLGGRYLPKVLQRAYETYPLFPSTVFVALGVNRNCSDLPHGFSPYLDRPIELPDGTVHHRFSVNVYQYDPTLAPSGKTLVTVLMNTWEWNKWEVFREHDKKAYEKAKVHIAEEVIDRLEHAIGNIASHIDMIDVSTPHSVIRYTGNWQGSFEGFAPTKATLSRRLPKTLPGLRNFSMIGQWTTPAGGLPTAAMDGRDLAVRLCREDSVPFRASMS